MPGLILFCTGLIIATMTEELPKWIKTIIWIVLVVGGLVWGGGDVLSVL